MIRYKYYYLQAKVSNFLHSVVEGEKGDTNFISIIIILGIVLLLVLTFNGFKDKIVGLVEDQVKSFTLKSSTPVK